MSQADIWIDQVRSTLAGYEEGLLREIARRLFRPRSQWPVDELIDRTVGTLTNIPVLDRRLKDLSAACRQVLALVGRSQQPRWPVGSLIEMLKLLGQADGVEPIQTLFESGLLFPHLPASAAGQRIGSFAAWLRVGSPNLMAFVPPQVSTRALKEPLGCEPGWRSGLTAASPEKSDPVIREADGLDWPLRLAVLWQLVAAGPLRRTLHGDFFKRDLDRLRQDPLLSAQPHDALAEIPDPALLTVSLALALGVLVEKPDDAGELIAGNFPETWQDNLVAALTTFWSRLPFMRGWNGADGWQADDAFTNPSSPYPALYLIGLLLLGPLGEQEWVHADAVEDWLLPRHPYWNPSTATTLDNVAEEARQKLDAEDRGALPSSRNAGEAQAAPPRSTNKAPLPKGAVTGFLLAVAFPLRLLQATRAADGTWLLRLSPIGRSLLGLAETPARVPVYPQTLLVQPNLEILAYRQGLTPDLIVRLSRFAAWKGLGAACTLQMEPASVYRALESGETFASLVQVLERHGMKATPASVIESLRTWSNKRDRITVCPAGVLLEFPGPAELADALARGIPAMRLSDRLAILPNEKDIDYRHFKLTGTRDYAALPEKCVDVDADGVTLNIDLSRSDLLLETELVRFAEPVPATPATPQGRKQYRLTPASMAAGRSGGLLLSDLERWFQQRTGAPLPASALMLFTGPEAAAARLRRQLVLHLPSEELADGLLQWPATQCLIDSRLGPTALSLSPENAATLKERLRELGMDMNAEEP